jgi:3-phytase
MKYFLMWILVAALSGQAAGQTIYEVGATGETDPVTHVSLRVDDASIWIHPSDPALSTFICTDKNEDSIGVDGLRVYDLSGSEIQFLNIGEMNNVDLRYNFPLGGESVTLVTSGNRTDDSIAILKVNPATRMLTNVAARTILISNQVNGVYGSCMYHSPVSRKYYVFVNCKNGFVEQWELFDTGSNTVDAVQVRMFDAGTQVEGCVADDELGNFYIGEENVAIWKYGAEPGDGTARTQVDTATGGGHLIADVEGLTLYYSANGGYLIASSQGEGNLTDPLAHTFAVYERTGTNAFVMNFKIVDSNGVDKVTLCDGVDVCGLPLGPGFPQGVFIAHDDANAPEGGENFKLVPWENIATAPATSLLIDTNWDPRAVGNPDGDTDGDGLPNSWESTHFGGTTAADPSAISSNGVNTLQECYIADINPVDPDAFFLISDLRPLTSVLSWNASSGRVYSVYWTSNLVSGFPVLPFASNLTSGVYTDLLHTAEEGFYRIEVQVAE